MANKKTGEIVDLNSKKPDLPKPSRREPQIMGAQAISKTAVPQRLDKSSPVEPTEVQTVVHDEIVTVKQHVRSKPLRKDEPDVRIHLQPGEES